MCYIFHIKPLLLVTTHTPNSTPLEHFRSGSASLIDFESLKKIHNQLQSQAQVLITIQGVLDHRLPQTYTVDLPEDTPYQVVEEEIMTVEDYDRVIENGWTDFFYE